MTTPPAPPPPFTEVGRIRYPTVVPLISILKLEAAWSVSTPTPKIAVLFPPVPGRKVSSCGNRYASTDWRSGSCIPAKCAAVINGDSCRTQVASAVHEKGPPFTVVPPV